MQMGSCGDHSGFQGESDSYIRKLKLGSGVRLVDILGEARHVWVLVPECWLADVLGGGRHVWVLVPGVLVLSLTNSFSSSHAVEGSVTLRGWLVRSGGLVAWEGESSY